MREYCQKSMFLVLLSFCSILNASNKTGENCGGITLDTIPTDNTPIEILLEGTEDCSRAYLQTQEYDFVPVLKCQFEHPGIITYSLPLFADIDGDGETEIVVALEHSPDGFAVINPNTCEAEYIVDVQGDIRLKDGGPVLGDVDRDGYVDIFIEVSTRITRWEYDPDQDQIVKVWETPEGVSIADRSHLDILDLNQDSIPELIPNIGQMVCAVTGHVYPGELPILNTEGKALFAFTADADPGQAPIGQGNVELIHGTHIYRYDFINEEWLMIRDIPGYNWGELANVSIADMDLDGDIDAVITQWDEIGQAMIWDIQTDELLGGGVFDYPGERGSRMNISNMDEDRYPEMVMTSVRKIFAIDDIMTTGGFGSIIWLDETSDNSGHTQLTSFDFDGNGTYEVAYRDETRLRIFSGMGTGEPDGEYPSTARVLLNSGDENTCESLTGMEYPTIGDIDNDNQAEIVATCRTAVSVYESGSLPWGNASRVWNTQAFNITCVNQDGTIPVVQVENYTLYNNFLAQVNLNPPNDTLFVYIPDVMIEIVEVENDCAGNISVNLEVCSQGAQEMQAGTPVALYIGDPTSGEAELLDVFTIEDALEIGECITINSDSYMVTQEEAQLFAVVNDNGQTNTPYILADTLNGGSFPLANLEEECDYTNNIDDVSVIIASHDENTVNAVICNGEAWETDGLTFTQAGTHTYTLTTSLGCDSIITLNLEILSAVTSEINAELCEGETFAFGSNNYDQTGVYVETLQAASGCDSVVTLNLAMLSPANELLQAVICAGEEYLMANNNYSTTGTYTEILQTVDGCDSTITLELQVLPVLSTYLQQDICAGESYLFAGEYQSTSGTYIQTLQSSTGCDSVVNLELNVLPTTTFSFNSSICAGEEFMWNGEAYAEAGNFDQVFTSSTGCDSTVSFYLEVLEASVTELAMEVCAGENVIVGNTTYSTSGSYQQVLQSANGCDSLVMVNLEVLPQIEDYFLTTICEGETYQLNGQDYNQAGSYTSSYQSVTGCDSIVHFQLNILENHAMVHEMTICEGDSALVFGNYESVAGIYTEMLQTSTGCDSTIEYQLTVLPSADIISADARICEGETVQLEVFGGNETFEWAPATGLSCTDCADPEASPSETTTYTVTSIGCANAIIQTTVTVEVAESPEIVASEDLIIAPGQSVRLQSAPSENAVYISWETMDGELICEDCKEIIVNPEQPSTYLVTAMNDAGCVATDEVVIEMRTECIESDFMIPNMISPNGDGTNDKFYIEPYIQARLRFLRIYDRWGELMFYTDDFSKKWDGTFRGQTLNPGVYVYHLEIDCPDSEIFHKVGNITILK